MIAEGHEVGNHTYTHPNLATRRQDADPVRAERDPAAVRGLHRAHAASCSARPISATPSRPPPTRSSRCWQAQNRGYRLRRPARRQRGLAAARASQAIIDNVLSRVLTASRELQRRVRSAVQPQHRPAPRLRRRPQPDRGGAADHHRYAARARLPLRAGVGAGRAVAAAGDAAAVADRTMLAARDRPRHVRIARRFASARSAFLFAAAIVLGHRAARCC